MECAYAPYNWTQEDDSNNAVPISGSSSYANGYDVMIAQYICQQLGWELEIVKTDWDSIVPAVQSGAVDCGICGQSITSDRLEMVDFSTPYYYATIVTLTQADGEYAGATSVADLPAAPAPASRTPCGTTCACPRSPTRISSPARTAPRP